MSEQSDFQLIASTPRKSRQGNGLVALKALYFFGALSRADLARKMGLNRSSSGHIIAGLLEKGLVREVKDDSNESALNGVRGRPGILIELEAGAAYFLGIEIGVGHITTLVIDLTGSVVLLNKQGYECGSKPAEEAIKQAVNQAMAMLPEAIKPRLEGVGFSVPAQMNSEGYIFNAALLKWQNVNFIALAQRVLPCSLPIKVENDANAYAIGKFYRSEERHEVTLFLVIESGVGGALVINGALFRGGNGLAMEIGHLIYGDNDAHRGQNLETLIGLENLLAKYKQAKGVGEATLCDFLRDVREREPSAVVVANDWARHLSYGIIQACRIIDPGRIVIGGSLAALYQLVSARVAAYIEQLQDMKFPLPEIIADDDAESGSAYGAACLLHQNYLSVDNPVFAIREA